MKRIGIIIERQRAYGRNLCEGIVRYAQSKQDWTLNMLSFEDIADAKVLGKCDAFIVRVLNDEIADALIKTGKPVSDVFVYRPRPEFASADQDAKLIGQLAAQHFLDHKFIRFAFFGHEGKLYSDLRRNAYVEAIKLQHFTCDIYNPPKSVIRDFDETVIRKEEYRVGTEKNHIRKWILKLEKPVAVFCSHDLRAYQLSEICREEGINVPRDVAILGVDDDFLLCNFTEPPLSSIDPNAAEIGYKAAQALAEMLDGGKAKSLHIPPQKLVERGSTMTYPLDPPWLSDALIFIGNNVSRKLIAADVFAHLGKSHTVVDAAFRKILGTTVSDEIAKSRIAEATRLLKSTQTPISEISKMSGFASVQYFTNAFTAATGKSPAKFRDTIMLQN